MINENDTRGSIEMPTATAFETTRQHTRAELATVLRLLERMDATTIVLGTSRDSSDKAASAALAEAWEARGGQVLASVDWPESAASWLRQARHFAAPEPDAWVVSARSTGWAHMSRRLADSTSWTPRRTIVTGSVTGAEVLAGGTADTFAGLQGVTRGGRAWRIGRGLPSVPKYADGLLHRIG